MKVRIGFAVIASLIPMLVAAQSVSPPPKPLHLVGDHWTPYNPPTEPPDGATVHVVERGDTLWDLAARYLGDPYLWPQLWERNSYILDSHWIYPGDPIVIDVAIQQPEPFEEEVFADDTVVSELPAQTTPVAIQEDLLEGEPRPLGGSADVYCFARLYPEDLTFPFMITSAEKVQYQDSFSEGDIVYIDGGLEEGVQAGDRFFIQRKFDVLKHPVSRARMGMIYLQKGQLRVLCSQEHTSICEVTWACDPIHLGDSLEPFSPVPVPLVVDPDPTDRCDEPNGKLTGYMVHVKDQVLDAGTEMLVFIDVGAAEGLYPGQFTTVFRDNPTAGMPRLVMGELGILTVGEHYATAKITRSWAPLVVGDRIELK